MIREILSDEAYGILVESRDAVLIDVRSTMEHEYVGHPKGSIPIAIKEPPTWATSPNFLDNIDSALKNKLSGTDDILSTKILLICRSGKRSGEAAELLEAAGYKNIFNIVDGFESDKDDNNHRNLINGWKFNNLPWEQS